MNRPKSVIIVAATIFLFSIYYLCIAITTQDSLKRGISIFMSLYFIISGTGLLKMKKWSRKMLLLISAFILVLDVFAFITLMPGRSNLIPSFIFACLILYYFTRPTVRNKFGS